MPIAYFRDSLEQKQNVYHQALSRHERYQSYDIFCVARCHAVIPLAGKSGGGHPFVKMSLYKVQDLKKHNKKRSQTHASTKFNISQADVPQILRLTASMQHFPRKKFL